MAYFAEKFKTLADDHGAQIAGKMRHVFYILPISKTLMLEFDVSEAFLIKSYKPTLPAIPPTEHTAVDDDESNADADSAEEVSAVYLVEPLRLTTTIVKFSGTLGSTTRTDLRSLTVFAFAHYVAEQTACRYIFADIQGVECPLVRFQ